MSLMNKLVHQTPSSADDVNDAIGENISGFMSSRAPIWDRVGDIDNAIWLTLAPSLTATIVNLGSQHLVRTQSKTNAEMIKKEALWLISQFEPRLTNVQLDWENVGLSDRVKFSLTANIVHLGKVEPLALDSFFDLSRYAWQVRKVSYG